MHDMPLPEIWHIDPVTAMVSSGESLIDPVVIVVEPRPSLTVVIAEICDFLRIRVERLPHGAGICQSLRDMQPIAVLSEAEEVDYRVYDLLMSVAEYDPRSIRPDGAEGRPCIARARSMARGISGSSPMSSARHIAPASAN